MYRGRLRTRFLEVNKRARWRWCFLEASDSGAGGPTLPVLAARGSPSGETSSSSVGAPSTTLNQQGLAGSPCCGGELLGGRDMVVVQKTPAVVLLVLTAAIGGGVLLVSISSFLAMADLCAFMLFLGFYLLFCNAWLVKLDLQAQSSSSSVISINIGVVRDGSFFQYLVSWPFQVLVVIMLFQWGLVVSCEKLHE